MMGRPDVKQVAPHVDVDPGDGPGVATLTG